MTVEEMVQALWDIEALKNLKARYFRHLDRQEWDSLLELFTSDATFELEVTDGFVCFDDPLVWLANLQKFLPGGWSIHHGHMPELHVDGDGARGTWAMYDQVHPGPTAGRDPFHGFGHYEEEYRRAEGSWRISSLRLTRLWVGAFAGT
jgi:SnoaL-like domain